jgi:hypothetical protein
MDTPTKDPLTPEAIRALPAGPRLDALVAERVLGHRFHRLYKDGQRVGTIGYRSQADLLPAAGAAPGP